MNDLAPVTGGPWDGRQIATPAGATTLRVLGRGCVEHYRWEWDRWVYVGRDFAAPTGFVVFT